MTDTLDTTADSATAGLSRRTIIAGAAWSVPAIVAVSATPAFAVSGAPTLTVTSPNMQAVAAGATPVSTRVTDDGGQPLAGRAVALTGPSGASFSPATPTTDGAGTATTTMTTTDPWATPGSSLTVTATTDGATTSAALTLLGANAYAVGYNWAGQLGTPVDGNTETVPTPAQLSLVFPSPIRSLTAGSRFSLALLDDGTMWAIGDNSSGQLGDGTTTTRSTWGPIPGLADVVQIAAGPASAYAVRSNGTVLAWGDNGAGQLGFAGTRSLTPTAVPGVSGATQVAAGGDNAYALVTNGNVYSWGNNAYAQLGNGRVELDPDFSYTAAPVVGLGGAPITGATQIASSGGTGYALISGSVYAWGAGSEGQLANGTSEEDYPRARPIAGLSGVTQIAGGGGTAFALTGGQVKSWGRGDRGQLGNNTTTSSFTIVTVTGVSNATAIAATSISAYAISSAGLSAWGGNDSGQLGDGTYIDRTTPITVQNTADVTTLMPPSNTGSSSAFFLRYQAPTLTLTSPDMRTIAAGTTPMTSVLTDVTGRPHAGQTLAFTGPAGTTFSPATAVTDAAGTITTTMTTTDTWATPGSTIDVIANGAGLSTTSALTVLGANAYGVGLNHVGQLGIPSSTGTSVRIPQQTSMVFPSPIRSISSNYSFALAVLEDGTVWGTGRNESGQLGDGTTNGRTTWGRVAGLSDVVKVATGGQSGASSYALLSDGTMLAWGVNTYGQLGNGTTADSTVPVPVSNVSGATDIAAGVEMAYALVANGEVRAWGRGNYRQVPGGDTSTPRAVPIVTGATQIAAGARAGYALVNGQVYAWGVGRFGEIGNGAWFDSDPTLVSNLTGVTQIAAGYYNGYALTGGTVRAWGSNERGMCGDGTTTRRNTPVTVTGLAGVTSIGAIGLSGYALSAGGVFSWGENGAGQLGDGSTTTRLTPVSVQGTQNVTGFSNDATSYSPFLLR